MNTKKSKQKLAENKLRQWVRQSARENKINENLDDVWQNSGFGGLIDAWRPFFKTFSVGSQQVLSNVIATMRLFTTYNGKKAQQILDRQRDRNDKFNAELDAIDTPIGPDVAFWMFLANPGASIALALSEEGKDVADKTVDWLKGAGVGDFAIDELEAGGHVAKRKREEEEAGPALKLLRSLEDLFLLRMGAENEGNLITEQAVNDIADIIGPEIASGTYGAQFDKMRQELMAYAEELSKEIDGAETQVSFLKNLTKLSSLEDLSSSIEQLKQMAPDADLGNFEQLPDQLKKDAVDMMGDEEAKIAAAKNLLLRQGNEEPSEEEIAEVPENELTSEMEGIAFANAISGFRQSAGEQIQGIKQIYSDMLKELFPPLDGTEEEMWKESEYGQAIDKIKDRVEALAS